LRAISSDTGTEETKRELRFYETQLLSEVRARQNHASGALSSNVLRTRFNIAAGNLAPRRAVRNKRPFELSPERGELLATLIASGFPFDSKDTNLMQASGADLTALPQYPKDADREVALGPIDLSGSYNPTSGFIGYDLTQADLSNAVLPGAKALARSTLRRISKEPPRLRIFGRHRAGGGPSRRRRSAWARMVAASRGASGHRGIWSHTLEGGCRVGTLDRARTPGC
jgi:hypothetical protein